MKKKFIRIIALVTILIGMVFTSLAYFTDRAEVTNTFTIGKIEIELDEPRYVELENEGATLLPGQTIEKDPTITIKGGSEDLVLGVYVKNGLYPAIGDLDIDPTLWEIVHEDPVTNETVYFYIGPHATNGIIARHDNDIVLEALFTEFTVLADLDNEDFIGFDPAIHNIEIKVLAHQALANGVPIDNDILFAEAEAVFGITF